MPESISRPAPDVREGTARLTYAELADVRGISRPSAERLARRKRWPRQAGNDGIVRVLVPESEAAPEPPGKRKRVRPDIPPLTPADVTQAVREAVMPLTQLLNDALAAERIARGEAAGLRAELDRRREWGLLRRLRWALRPR